MDSAAAHRAGAAFEAMLLKDVLAPLTRGTQGLGDFGANALAQTIAEHDANGFGALIAARLEHAAS